MLHQPGDFLSGMIIMKRRTFLVGAGVAAATGAGVHWLTRGPDYDSVAANLWSHRSSASGAGFADLVHYATLAANSHNAQPWHFRQTPVAVVIAPDFTRALPVVDADNHHLYASLGCAAENLMLAVRAAGRSSELTFDPAGAGRVQVTTGRAGAARDALFEAIPDRQCTRSDYDGRALGAADRTVLLQAARVDGCELLLIEDRARVEQVLELILAATTIQVSDPAFVAELRSWLRFNARAAVERGDGLYVGCSGNPALPTWLGSILFGAFFKPAAENERYARQVRSSAGLAVFVSERDDPAHWVQAGRSYQRFALQATALGIRHAHLNQPLEIAPIRRQLGALLGVGDRRVDLMVRYGHAAPMPRSLRRPVSDVIIAA
jgi:hypothetical protein